MFCRKDVLRNLAKFTGEHLCQSLFFNKVAGQSLFFNKVAGLRPATLLKKRHWHRCFPVNFAKFLRTPLFTEHSGGCFCTAEKFVGIYTSMLDLFRFTEDEENLLH